MNYAKNTVSVGPASIAGWVAFVAAEVAAFAELNPAGLGTNVLSICGFAALVLANGGRQLQAAARERSGRVTPAYLPSDDQELEVPAPRPQSATRPDGSTHIEG